PGADDRLYNADEEQMAACGRIDHAQHVRIQRRLVEDLAAEPFAARDPARPLVVDARIAHEEREERRRAHLPHVRHPHDERGGEDPDRGGREPILLCGQQRYASAACPQLIAEPRALCGCESWSALQNLGAATLKGSPYIEAPLKG